MGRIGFRRVGSGRMRYGEALRANALRRLVRRIVGVELRAFVGQHGGMRATVEQTQNDLSKMIRLAIGGEEILITDGGKPVAKLTGISQMTGAANQKEWLQSLRQLRETTATHTSGRSAEKILAEDRAERD